MSCEKAFDEICRCSGTQFCPEVVDCFMSLKDRVPDMLCSVNNDINHSAFTRQEDSMQARSILPDTAEQQL